MLKPLMETKAVRLEIPRAANVISADHFIKTVEDLYEAIVQHGPADEIRYRLQ